MSDAAVLTDDDRGLIRHLLRQAQPVDAEGFVTCPVCEKRMKRAGFGPHKAGHLRTIGDLPQQDRPKRKPKVKLGVGSVLAMPPAPKPEPVYEPSTRDICVGVLFGLIGSNASIPMSELDEVLGWIDCTEQLVDRLRQAGTNG
jgi:hypothetical protein